MKNLFSDLRAAIESFSKNITKLDLIPLIASSIAFVVMFYTMLTGAYKIRDNDETIKNQMITIGSQVEKMSELVHGVNDDLSTMLALKKDSSLISNYNLYKLKSSIDSLESRFSKIEKLIAQDPTKSLEMTMLKKDMDSEKATVTLELDHIKSDIDKANTIIIASIFTLAVGILGTLIVNIGKRDNKDS